MADVSVLEVLLHGEPIGTLTQVGGDRNFFAFNDDYIDNSARPTLSLAFKDTLGNLITDIPTRQTRVPPFFANLLPEGPLREYLARQAGVKSQREFFLLWVLGRDMPGAVTVRPADGEAWPQSGHDEGGRDHGHGAALRFSLAGVQLKFSAMMEATGGLTIPAQGVGGSWIVKLPSASFDRVPENEFAMMSLARAIGIDVPEIALHRVDQISGLPEGLENWQGHALAVKRFDRAGDGTAVHIEDFAQVFGVYPEDKYQKASYRNIAQVIWAEAGEPGITEFTRRLVFSTLIGNADMHLKNWSLIYPDRRNVALAPGYDFVSTIPYLPDGTMALKYARTRRMTELSRDELVYLAAKAKLPEQLVIRTAAETVERFFSAWNVQKSELPLTADMVSVIDRHAHAIALVRDVG